MNGPRRREAALLAAALLAACSKGRETTNLEAVHAIAVTPTVAALCVGDTQRFTAAASNAEGDRLTGVAMHWASSAPNAISVDSTGLAHALTTGTTVITASAQNVTSNGADVDAPADLVPELVPDSAVLAPGDTMTLGVRMRRLSGGPVPDHEPVIAPFDSAVASLGATGLLRAKTVGRVSPSLSACGFQGSGAVDVFVPPNAGTGSAYLWLSGPEEVRYRAGARVLDYPLHGGAPGFQIVSNTGPVSNPSKLFIYVDTLSLSGPGRFPIDSLLSSEIPSQLCAPPRPAALFIVQSPLTAVASLTGGSLAVTAYTPRTGYTAVSGRAYFRVRGFVNGASRTDTLTAIYTFSAPLVDTTGVCP